MIYHELIFCKHEAESFIVSAAGKTVNLLYSSVCLTVHHSSRDCESIQKFHWLKFIQITTEWVNNSLLFMIPDYLFYYISSPFKQMNCRPQLYNWQQKWLGSRLLVLIFSPINLCYSHYHQKTILYANVSVERKSTYSSEFISKIFHYKLLYLPVPHDYNKCSACEETKNTS